MDASVKQKQSQALLAAQGLPMPYPLLHQPLPLDLSQPTVPAGFLPPRPPPLQQDEVLDLTYSPPGNSLPSGLAETGSSLGFWPAAAPQPHQQPHPLPLHFRFPSPFDGTAPVGSVPLVPAQHEPLPQAQAPPPLLPDDFALPDTDINYKELLEEMLSSLNVGPQEDASPERQSVIQFSGPFSTF